MKRKYKGYIIAITSIEDGFEYHILENDYLIGKSCTFDSKLQCLQAGKKAIDELNRKEAK